MDRRTFLAGCAAAPLVYGLDRLFAQEEDRAPECFRAAMRRMKETNRWGIALVAPADENERIEFGARMLALLESKDPGVRELFCEAVFVCLAPEAADCLRGAGEKESGFVLDPDGKRAAADTVPAAVFEKPETFQSSIARLLHGERDGRLRAAVERIRRSLPEVDRSGIEQAFDLLDSPERDAPDDAVKIIARHRDRIAPWIVYARMDAVHAKGRERIQGILLELYDRSPAGSPGPRLPYGSSIHEEPARDPCPGCGMAAAPARSRRFLKFLAG